MNLTISSAGFTLALMALANSPAFAATVAATAGASEDSEIALAETPKIEAFVPADFAVPTLVETPGFKLVPLGPELAEVDFGAYMSSIEHLQATFTRSTGWPHKDITRADAMSDMESEQARFESRKSFAYAVLTPDGTRERGLPTSIRARSRAMTRSSGCG